MCGIWFYIAKQKVKSPGDLYNAFNLTKHRGPDSSVFQFVKAFTEVYIGFHRLSIKDPTVNGNQPFCFEKGAHQVYAICNGEIYNHKKVIEKFNLKPTSSSDCEVIPRLYLLKGFDAVEAEVHGEFAYLIIDINHETNEIKVHASEDPFGVRPLFFAEDDKGIAFCSELRGLRDISSNIQRFSPGTSSIYTLTPGADNTVTVKSEKRRYYSYDYTKRIDCSDLASVQKQINDTLTQCVVDMLDSDRPLGALLSGGLDSSLVCSIAARELAKHGQKLRTYSIGMKGGTDQKYAEMVANHIGSIHTHIELTQQDFLDALDDVVTATETWDTTTIRASTGQFLISKWIVENTDIKVVLIGDGSDELTAGYMYFHKAPSPQALHDENKRLLEDIHLYDVLRADRGISYNSLEARVPFLDRRFCDLYMSIDPKLRMTTKCEKWLLRSSFDDTKEFSWLPKDVLWRRKEAFSDGVSSMEKPWYVVIQDKAEEMFSEEDLKKASTEYTHCPPYTKESLYFRRMFDEKFGKVNDRLIPYYWLPKWCGDIKEPSARVLDVYK